MAFKAKRRVIIKFSVKSPTIQVLTPNQATKIVPTITKFKEMKYFLEAGSHVTFFFLPQVFAHRSKQCI